MIANNNNNSQIRPQIIPPQPQIQTQNITQILNNKSGNYQQQQQQHDQYQQNLRQQQLILQQQQQQQQASIQQHQALPQPPPPPTQQVPYIPHRMPPTPEQRPQLSIFDELSNSIKACNAADSVHKSNVRYVLDNIERALDGPQLKLVFFKEIEK